jgi:hypothetical protein
MRILNFLYDERTGLPVRLYQEAEVKDYATRVYHHVFRAYDKASSLYNAAA